MSSVMEQFEKSKKEIPEIRYVLPGSKEEIFMRPYTTREQKHILKAIEKQDDALIEEAFDQLLKVCVTSSKFDPNKLYAKDRECLLIEISKESVKDDYNHRWTCEECQTPNQQKIRLDDINIFSKIESYVVETEIDFEDCDFTVRVSNPKREDEKNILAFARKEAGTYGTPSQTDMRNATLASVMKKYKKKIQKQVKNSTTGELEDTTIEVYEDIKFADRISIFESLSVRDKKKVSDYIENIKKVEYNFSIGDHSCKKCSHVQALNLEWMDFFIQ
jgi:hypothetical protein